MCYYNGVAIKKEQKIRLGGIEKQIHQLDLLLPLSNGFEYKNNIVIKPDGHGWDFANMEWGFLPGYLKNREEVNRFRNGYKDATGKFKPAFVTLNAIGEELLFPNKMFRESALQRRCLILSSGFYEWCHVPQIGKKGQLLKKVNKFPYHIRLKDQPYFFMAGIWQPWTDRETGETIETFSIITTKANGLMEEIHNSKKRMPVILPEKEAAEWISPTCEEERIAQLACFQIPEANMEAYTIASDFRQSESPDQPFSYDGLKNFV